MASTNLGRVLIIPKGTWDGNLEYTRLNLVSYAGGSYVAKQDVPSGTAINNDYYWQLVATKGDTGGLGQVADSFNEETNYVIGDYCIYENDLYRFIAAHSASAWDGTDVLLCNIGDEIKRNRIYYYTGQNVSVATDAQIMRIPASGTDSRITTNTIVLSCIFEKQNYAPVVWDVDWTSYAGYILFTGTCSTATTADVTLGSKGN